MDNTNPTPPPQIPPQIPRPTPPSATPLGENAEERTPIQNAFAAVEAILRQPRRLIFQLRQPGAGKLIALMLLVSVVCAVVYGVIVGTFSRGDQLWIAPVKIAGGLMVSALICLPSLYIFACLSGSQARLSEVFGFLAGLLTLLTLLLVGFAPVALIFSTSTESLNWMGTLHIAFWFIATCFGLRFFNAAFSHSNAKSQSGLSVWALIFILVMLQMTTALRPILGKSENFFPTEKKFFITHWVDCLKSSDTQWNKRRVND